MSRPYNFAAGPAMLPESVLMKVQEQLFNYQKTGMSIMEMGHRTPTMQNLLVGLEQKLREILLIPSHFKLLFLPGGAQGHFSFIPMNLCKHKKTADYLISGIWSQRAADFAERYIQVKRVRFSDANWELTPNAAYVYYCPNETIEGVQIHTVPKSHGIPLVADMTSCILSKPIDFSPYGLIFASAQKNLGIAGITLLIIREDLLHCALDFVPEIFNYTLQVAQHSLLNTIPVMPIYMMDLMIDWLNEQGGLNVIAEINHKKAQTLYTCIDESQSFYSNKITNTYRSEINVPFQLPNDTLLQQFLVEASEQGLVSLKGHRLVGGARASLYNAMPDKGVKALVNFMSQFSKDNKEF